jgi:hypothetical protein
MGVLSVTEKFDRRRSSYKSGVLTHTRVFGVKLDSPVDGTAAALVADDGTRRVPSPGDTYLDTIVNSIEADPEPKSAVHFLVTVESTDAGDLTAIDTHPLDRPPEISFGSSDTTEPYFLDCGDDEEEERAVTNSAGDPFEQFLERERGEMVITITRNEDFHDATAADEFSHTVNVEPVMIEGTTFAPGTLKLSPITASKVIETWQGATVEYYRRTYVLKARREGWDDHPLDIGLNEAFDAEERANNGNLIVVRKRRPIVDANGLPVKKPVPLVEGKRKLLTPTDLEPVALTFRPYRKLSWSPINLNIV